VRRRAPYYVSDWTDAWDYRVVPATVYIVFCEVGVDGSFFFLLPYASLLGVYSGDGKEKHELGERRLTGR
jgi:hypothetical protein